MGSHFQNVLKEKRECSCEKGYVFYYNEEWESDYPPFSWTEDGERTTNCPDNCEKLKKDYLYR